MPEATLHLKGCSDPQTQAPGFSEDETLVRKCNGELLGRKDVKAGMVCIHVLNEGVKGVRNPAADSVEGKRECFMQKRHIPPRTIETMT